VIFLNKILNSRAYHLVFFAILWFILEFEFKYFVNIPLFQEKMGFDFEFNLWKYLFAKLLIILVLVMNYKLSGFNYLINSLFVVLLTIPNLILFQFMPTTTLSISLSILGFHFILFLSSFIKIPEIKRFNYSFKIQIEYVLLIIISLFLLPILFAYGFDINWAAFKFDESIYQIRSAAVLKRTFFSGYFYSWLIKILIPMAIIISFKSKNYYLLVLMVFIQLYLFSIEAQKSAFFTLILLPIFFIKSFDKQIGLILTFIISGILFSILISLITENIMAESIVVRRSFFLPAVINQYYFEFFDHNQIYLSHSVLRHFIDYPFDLAPPQLIGREFFNNAHANVNAGFIADGFMNFGFFGIVFNILGVVLIFRILDYVKISSDYSGIVIVIVYTFISSYFLTSLLTHGVIIFLVLSFLLLRNNQPSKL
jgi:hypothetical protein